MAQVREAILWEGRVARKGTFQRDSVESGAATEQCIESSVREELFACELRLYLSPVVSFFANVETLKARWDVINVSMNSVVPHSEDPSEYVCGGVDVQDSEIRRKCKLEHMGQVVIEV